MNNEVPEGIEMEKQLFSAKFMKEGLMVPAVSHQGKSHNSSRLVTFLASHTVKFPTLTSNKFSVRVFTSSAQPMRRAKLPSAGNYSNKTAARKPALTTFKLFRPVASLPNSALTILSAN